MSYYSVKIKKVETYESEVVVAAESPDEAKKKVDFVWYNTAEAEGDSMFAVADKHTDFAIGDVAKYNTDCSEEEASKVFPWNPQIRVSIE